MIRTGPTTLCALALLAPCTALHLPTLGAPSGRAAGCSDVPPALSRRSLLQLGVAAQLATSPLAALATNFDPDRYGDKELKIATVNKIKQVIRTECSRDLSLLVPLLQLALLDAFSYRADGTGGIDGSILLEMGRGSTAGLDKATAKLRQVRSSSSSY